MIAGLRAVTLLAVCAVSVVLFGWQVLSDQATSFARDNTLLMAERRVLLGSMAASFALVLAVGSVSVKLGDPGAIRRIQRLARISAPLVLIGFVPALLTRGLWEPLPTAVAIAAFTLLFERLMRVSLAELATPEWNLGPTVIAPPTVRERRVAFAVVALCTAFYAAYMSRYTIWSHRRFGTYGYDLGQYDNVFWTTLHGHPFRCAPLGLVNDWQDIGNHADLSVLFFLPFYAIRPNAETLLILQACVLALGAIPLYLFAVRRLPPFYAAGIAICYLLFPPLHGSNFYDFHFQPIASTVVLFVIYFIDSRRWVLAAIAFVVGLGCREDTSVGLSMLGLYLVLSGYRPRAGAVMAVVAAAYFVAIKFVIMPHFWASWFAEIYKDLYPHPDGAHTFGGIIQTLITNPIHVFHTLLTADKLRYFLQIMVPIAFLPLRRTPLLPALAPGTLFTLLTTEYPPTIDIGFQYSGHFTPYVFAASALLLASYRWDDRSRVKMRAGLAAMVAGTLLCTTQWGAFPPRGTIKGGFSQVSFARPSAHDEQKARDLADLFAMIPASATFSVTEEELPHVSGHLNVFTLKTGTNSADYLLYGTGSFGASAATQALQAGEYVELAQRPGLMLLKKKR